MKCFPWIFFLLLLLGAVAGLPAAESEYRPEYRFEYRIQGQARGVFLLLFPYRVFFHADASVHLGARATGGGDLEFYLKSIDEPGRLVRTMGFSGKTLVGAAAHQDPARARRALEHIFSIVRQAAPRLIPHVKRRETFPYRILSHTEDGVTFKRAANGTHRDVSVTLPLQKLRGHKKYDFYFNIYPILGDILDMYNHPLFPGGVLGPTALEADRQWQSPELDFSAYMNRVGWKTVKILKRHVHFQQKAPLRLNYRVESRTPDQLAIRGGATPDIPVWKGVKITRIERQAVFRLPDGMLREDNFTIIVGHESGKGIRFDSTLSLVR